LFEKGEKLKYLVNDETRPYPGQDAVCIDHFYWVNGGCI